MTAAASASGQTSAPSPGDVYFVKSTITQDPRNPMWRPVRPQCGHTIDTFFRGMALRIDRVTATDVVFEVVPQSVRRQRGAYRLNNDCEPPIQWKTRVFSSAIPRGRVQKIIGADAPHASQFFPVYRDVVAADTNGLTRNVTAAQLDALVERELAFFTTGSEDAKAVGTYATANVAGGNISLGANIPTGSNRTVGWVLGPRITGKVNDGNFILRGRGADESAIRFEGRATYFKAAKFGPAGKGSLTNAQARAASVTRNLRNADLVYASTYWPAMHALDNNPTLTAKQKKAAASKALKEARAALSKIVMDSVFAYDKERFRLKKHYFFGEGGVAVTKQRFEVTSGDSTAGNSFRGWSANLGYGYLLRHENRRFNLEATGGVTYVSNV